MLPITFKQANHIFTEPNGLTDEQCGNLPVFKGKDMANLPVIISCWKFSKEDLEYIQQTGCIFLSIMGEGMPPVSLIAENPFEY